MKVFSFEKAFMVFVCPGITGIHKNNCVVESLPWQGLLTSLSTPCLELGVRLYFPHAHPSFFAVMLETFKIVVNKWGNTSELQVIDTKVKEKKGSCRYATVWYTATAVMP